jgi:hypothetical protein
MCVVQRYPCSDPLGSFMHVEKMTHAMACSMSVIYVSETRVVGESASVIDFPALKEAGLTKSVLPERSSGKRVTLVKSSVSSAFSYTIADKAHS